MEVLRHGKTYKEIECKNCGALLSYCIKDIKIDFDCSKYFGEIHSSSKEYIVCPECDKTITLSFIVDGEEQQV